MTFRSFFACVLAVAVFAPRTPPSPPPLTGFSLVYDLSHPQSERFPNWEGSEKSPFEAKPLGDIARDGYFTRYICTQEHFATHIDAPAHFAAGRWTVDQIPPERLIGPLVVLNVAPKIQANADYQITVDDVSLWDRPTEGFPLAPSRWRTRDGRRARLP